MTEVEQEAAAAAPEQHDVIDDGEQPLPETTVHDDKPKAGTQEYYDQWHRYNKELSAADEEKAEPCGLPPMPPGSSNFGYEIRPGHKTKFPDIKVAEGETDEAAAYRIAVEKRAEGKEAFADGTVWGAQQAVDAWGGGLLSTERCKNLRKYRKARLEGGTSTKEDLAVEASEEADEKEDDAEYEASGMVTERVRRVPTSDEVRGIQVILRLNIAQALIKLKAFEKATVYCDHALELEPDNIKALWRKSQATWGIRNPGMARESLMRLLQLDPGNAAALNMLREIDAEEARKLARRKGARPAQAHAAALEAAKASSAAVPLELQTKWFPSEPCAAAEEDRDEEEDETETITTKMLLSALPELIMDLRRSLFGCCRRRGKMD